jgi:hypothetical protein
MPADRLILVALALIASASCSRDGSDPTGPGVLIGEVSLPAPGAAYHGSEPHLFHDRSVTLFCGTHGVFSNAVEPPAQVGETVLSEYVATFVGELILEPPAVSSAVTHSLSVQARMAERITLAEIREAARIFDTELVTFELQGTGMPADIMVRESPDLASPGVTTVTADSGGLNRVESHYDVWLEISLDGGRTWDRAEGTVRMTLEPS